MWIIFDCSFCGKGFYGPPHGRHKYCSLKCKKIINKFSRIGYSLCEICNKLITLTPKRRGSLTAGYTIVCDSKECNKEITRWKNDKRRTNGQFESFLRIEIFERDLWICQICQKSIDKNIEWPNPLSASIDHIFPIVRGGDHTRLNVQAAHLSCNNFKRAKIM